MPVLEPLLHSITGVPGQSPHEGAAVHADTAMYSPGLHVDVLLAERLGPGVHVKVVRVDERSVDVEQHRKGLLDALGMLRGVPV